MKTITTKLYTNPNGRDVIATNGNAVEMVPYNSELSYIDNHGDAMYRFCQKKQWGGTFIGGPTEDGMIWIEEKEAMILVV